jgi:hypothetical protein
MNQERIVERHHSSSKSRVSQRIYCKRILVKLKSIDFFLFFQSPSYVGPALRIPKLQKLCIFVPLVYIRKRYTTNTNTSAIRLQQ